MRLALYADLHRWRRPHVSRCFFSSAVTAHAELGLLCVGIDVHCDIPFYARLLLETAWRYCGARSP